jgi:hypothetical protein
MSEYDYTKGSTDRRSIAGETLQGVMRPSRASPGDPLPADPGLAAALNGAARVRNLMAMQRMLDASPRMRSQRALQLALNRRAGEPVIQRARLNLRQNGTISGVSDFPSRPGSNVRRRGKKGGTQQGQHITAYVSFEDMILSHVRDRTVSEAANALIEACNAIERLPGAEYMHADIKSQIEDQRGFLTEAAQQDDAKTVGVVINNILKLRNMLPDTALGTAEKSLGHGEAKESGGLEVLETALRTGGPFKQEWGNTDDAVADDALKKMWRLLDYHPPTGTSDAAFAKTKRRVLRHVLQMKLSYPATFAWLSNRGSALMPYLKANRRNAGMPLSQLTDNEIDRLRQYVIEGEKNEPEEEEEQGTEEQEEEEEEVEEEEEEEEQEEERAKKKKKTGQ